MEVQRRAVAEHCEKLGHNTNFWRSFCSRNKTESGDEVLARVLAHSEHICKCEQVLETIPSLYVQGLQNTRERKSRSHSETRRADASMIDTVAAWDKDRIDPEMSGSLSLYRLGWSHFNLLKQQSCIVEQTNKKLIIP